MKNFAFALVTFFIWTLIGYGFHTLIHPQKKEPIEVLLPNSKPTDKLSKSEKSIKDSLNNRIKDSISKINNKLTIPKKILYLGFDKKDFTETKNIDNYLKSLKKYLLSNKQAQIYIVGFTDDIGDDKDNYWIGLERANNFKNFLISKNVEKKRIHTSSKGENEPMTKNNSLISRRKNRRIEITIKPN